MRVTSVRPKPIPRVPRNIERWLFALLWILFCAAMVAVALFLTPRIGAADVSDASTLPDDTAAPELADTEHEHGVPMAATVLYPNENLNETLTVVVKQ